MWELISRGLAGLGPAAMAITTSQPAQPLMPPDTAHPEEEDPEGLVEYEGMLVSASAAQRRRYTAHTPVHPSHLVHIRVWSCWRYAASCMAKHKNIGQQMRHLKCKAHI